MSSNVQEVQLNMVVDLSIHTNEKNQDPNQQNRMTVQEIYEEEQFKSINGALWEFIGTFFLTFGFLSAKAYGLYGGMEIESYNNAFGVGMTVGVAAAFGLQQTGSHYNPAISFNFFLDGKLSLLNLLIYSVVQILGSISGGVFFYYLNEGQAGWKSIADESADAAKIASFFFSELIGTFILGLFYNIQCHPYCSLTNDLFLKALNFFAVIITARTMAFASGGILNPAIAISVDLCTGWLSRSHDYYRSQYLWLYILAPLTGSALNLLFFKYFYAPLFQKLQKFR